MKCLAEQILGNWLEIISTYLENYSSDAEVKVKAELNELKRLCTIPFKGSKETQLIECNECRTLMMKFGMFGKIMTWYEKTLAGNNFVLCESVENNLKLDYELENFCSRETTQQTTD